MKTNDLYLEYARVIEMCKGTALEDKPWECVKLGEGTMTKHPNFIFPDVYSFAVSILEDKPLFIKDRLYSRTNFNEYLVMNVDNTFIAFCSHDDHVEKEDIHKELTWQPPAKKRTFKLDGVELPCPLNSDKKVMLNAFSISTSQGSNNFFFDTHEEMEETRKALCELLSK